MVQKPRFRMYAAIALVLVLTLTLPGCIKIVKEASEATAAPAATSAPTPAPAETPAPTPTEEPEYNLTFSIPGNAAVQQYMRLALCAPHEDAIALFGQPKAIYGANSYAYQAIAGADATEAAAVYRFMKDGIGFECIVSTLDGRILKKRVSPPAAFPKLLDGARAKLQQFPDWNAIGYQELLTAMGVNPYLWMSFVAPNAPSDEDRYEICLWPDDAGQLVAVVQNNDVLSLEYQPADEVLTAAAVDGVAPRAPRWLELKPDNDNSALSRYAAFKTFAGLKLGQSEQDVQDKMGAPTSQNNGTLTYAYADAAFATGQVEFTFSFADGKLTAKHVTALPLGDAEVRGRYAPQMLPGMSMDDIEHFMGSGLVTNQSLTPAGGTVSDYTYTGAYASVSALFVKGTDACAGDEMAVNDANEEQDTLYEEYVLPVIPGKPAKTRTPGTSTPKPTATPESATPEPTQPSRTIIPNPTPTPYTRPTPTPTPLITIIIPRRTFTLVTPTPSPTPIIIR
jgi:hypothetical protein